MKLKDFGLTNGGTVCDEFDGPCSCGAWHTVVEWHERSDEIFEDLGKDTKTWNKFLALLMKESKNRATN